MQAWHMPAADIFRQWGLYNGKALRAERYPFHRLWLVPVKVTLKIFAFFRISSSGGVKILSHYNKSRLTSRLIFFSFAFSPFFDLFSKSVGETFEVSNHSRNSSNCKKKKSTCNPPFSRISNEWYIPGKIQKMEIRKSDRGLGSEQGKGGRWGGSGVIMLKVYRARLGGY